MFREHRYGDDDDDEGVFLLCEDDDDDDDDDDVKSQVALAGELFCFTNQKEFNMEWNTTLGHSTSPTPDKGNFTWNSFSSQTFVDTRERIGNAAFPTVKKRLELNIFYTITTTRKKGAWEVFLSFPP